MKWNKKNQNQTACLIDIDNSSLYYSIMLRTYFLFSLRQWNRGFLLLKLFEPSYISTEPR